MRDHKTSFTTLFRAIFYLQFCLTPIWSFAQYWQQNADYKINVSLDDQQHILRGSLTLTYTNHSPQDLDTLYFHCWPNAYRTKNSDFAKQQIRNGSLDFRFAKPNEMGSMDSMNFEVDGKPTSFKFTNSSHEILALLLSTPLRSGQTLEVTTSFKVKLPSVFSRMGHKDGHYCITQWFPKVAKYDLEGWHTFPYLDLGEYFDEFGTYDVTITLPKEYVVAATGNLQTPSEDIWLKERVALSKKMIETGVFEFDQDDSGAKKTIRFTEKNIHDFAWFAHKKFLIGMEEMTLESGESFESWAFFTAEESKAWTAAPRYLSESVKFYSERVGDYPYQTVKAVEGPIVAGGGMEYPTITVVRVPPQELERVILHEVGHNWFQGMLATDERRYPFLDEGFNSYYENRMYEERANGQPGSDINNAFFQLGFEHTARRCEDQPCNLHSNEYSDLNYGLVVYGKASLAVRFLEQYLGRAVFDSCMNELFEKWRFKHPSTADFQKVFEGYSEKDLDWFFQGFLGEGYYDYGIKGRLNDQIRIENTGDIQAPVHIAFKKSNGETISQKWIEGFDGEILVGIPDGTSAILLNDGIQRFETEPKDNYYFVDQKAKKYDKITLRIINPIDDPANRELVVTPAVGYNTNAGTMLGLGLYNPLFPQRKFEYQLVVMTGLNNGLVSWLGNLGQNWFWLTNSSQRQLQIGLQSKSFSQGYFSVVNDVATERDFRYMKFQPYVRYLSKPTPFNHHKQHEWSGRWMVRNWLNIQTEDITWGSIGELNYTYTNSEIIFDRSVKLTARGNDQFLRISSEWKGAVPYSKKSKVYGRVFGGLFLIEPSNAIYNFRMTNLAGFFDYMLDDLVFDRSLQSSFFQRQLAQSDGGITTPNRTFGSAQRLLSVNLSADLPVLPLRAMFNGAMIPASENPFSGGNASLTYEAGLQLNIYKDIVAINMPFIYSRDFRNGRDGYLDINPQNFWDNITFTLQLSKLNPFKLSENYSIIQ